MIIAFDTYYFGNKAKTVCLTFDHWTEKQNYKIYTEILENIEAYTSGEFYKRELPCILSLLNQNKFECIEAIIVDGFVYLDDNNKLGLGAHLYQNLQIKVPVIGVAKTNFATLVKNKKLLTRGKSTKPLYITSIGIGLEEAAEKIQMMAGENRMPTLLKTLDTLTKENKKCG